MELWKTIADCENVDMATVRETADIQPKEFSKLSSGELIDMHEASSCDKKDEDTPEEVAPANTLYYRDWDSSCIENAKGKMLEAHPNLKRNIDIHHGIEKILALCHKVTWKRPALQSTQ